MTDQIPKRLRQEPLLEALLEIRFESDHAPVSELLPGMLFKELRGSYGKLVRLPAANIPHPIAERDEGLRYVPTVRLEGEPFAIQIGERVVSLSCRRPYVGWDEFSKQILNLAKVLEGTGLITRPERFSLKYIDLIDLRTQPSLSYLNVNFAVGGHDITERPVQLRTEIEKNGYIQVLQIASPAQAQVATGERFNGTLLDIDTIKCSDKDDFWQTLDVRIHEAHTHSKQLFFDLLSKDTLEKLEPEY